MNFLNQYYQLVKLNPYRETPLFMEVINRAKQSDLAKRGLYNEIFYQRIKAI